MPPNAHRAQTGDGRPVHPGTGVVPILKELEPGRLAVIGTGFYITRYGLFLTAGHVLEDLVDWEARTVGAAYVWRLDGDDGLYLRKVLRVSLLQTADVAIGQADNYVEQYPERALQNLRVRLTTQIPVPGTRLVTYAYPENAVLDFRGSAPTIVADYFDGELLRYVEQSDNPLLPYPHFETTIEIRSGASGGPVSDTRGRVIGVNCRGWDFRGGEHEGDNLSSIVPIGAVLPLVVEIAQLPTNSWEYAQVPEDRRDQALTVSELAMYRHVWFDPPL
jgi:hypothetical protein